MPSAACGCRGAAVAGGGGASAGPAGAGGAGQRLPAGQLPGQGEPACLRSPPRVQLPVRQGVLNRCALFRHAQISYLEVEVETLAEQLRSPAACEDAENGSVTVDDVDHIQKVNRELEQQLGDKSRVSRCCSGLPGGAGRTFIRTLFSRPSSSCSSGWLS